MYESRNECFILYKKIDEKKKIFECDNILLDVRRFRLESSMRNTITCAGEFSSFPRSRKRDVPNR